MKLSVVLRTHDGSSVHANKRFVTDSKSTIVRKCAKSLIDSVKFCEQKDNISITIIDDHSSTDTINFLKDNLQGLNYTFINLEKNGNNASMVRSYEAGLQGKEDFIYFVEDDYFHLKETIPVLMDTWKNFDTKLGSKPLVLVPYDDPLDYLPERMIPTRVVHGNDRHWRQSYHTTQTMFMTKWILMHYWDKFMEFSQYGLVKGNNEDNTINLLYSKYEVFLFSPLPFLAFHICDIPPLVGNWKKIWEES